MCLCHTQTSHFQPWLKADQIAMCTLSFLLRAEWVITLQTAFFPEKPTVFLWC